MKSLVKLALILISSAGVSFSAQSKAFGGWENVGPGCQPQFIGTRCSPSPNNIYREPKKAIYNDFGVSKTTIGDGSIQLEIMSWGFTPEAQKEFLVNYFKENGIVYTPPTGANRADSFFVDLSNAQYEELLKKFRESFPKKIDN